MLTLGILYEVGKVLGHEMHNTEFMKKLKHAIEMADTVYSMDYTDDARLTLLERKVNAIIEYLLNSE